MKKNYKGVQVVVPKHTEGRLSDKCFRGPDCSKAGNFRYWKDTKQVIEGVITDSVLSRLQEAAMKNGKGTFSICLDLRDPIGWSSTAPRDQYVEADLVSFEPNNHSSALKVVNPEKLAPLTNHLTIVCEYKRKGGVEVFVIHSMYPGKDVGVLDGDITQREKVVFFDWEHQGEPWKRNP